MWLMFKTEMLMYQSKANLDVKFLFGKITHLSDPKIRRMPLRSLYENQEFHVPFWSMLHLALKFELIFSFANRI